MAEAGRDQGRVLGFSLRAKGFYQGEDVDTLRFGLEHGQQILLGRGVQNWSREGSKDRSVFESESSALGAWSLSHWTTREGSA